MMPRRIHGISPDRSRPAFTLVEVLVATVVTLMIVGSLTIMFGTVSEQVVDSRALTALNDTLRQTKNLLSFDLLGSTAPTIPPLDPAAQLGYFETIEGPIGPVFYPVSKFIQQNNLADDANIYTYPLNDTNLPNLLRDIPQAGGEVLTEDTTLGDPDDILMFTARSLDQPFVATGFPNATPTMHAEIVWFVRGRTLYRRVLNIASGGPNSIPLTYANSSLSLRMGDFRQPGAFFTSYLPNTNTSFFLPVGNDLGDLTKRENRFGHQPAMFPHDARFWMRVNPNGQYVPWVIARPGFMMPTIAETDAGFNSTLGWPFPAEWASKLPNLRHQYLATNINNDNDPSNPRVAQYFIPYQFYNPQTSPAPKTALTKLDLGNSLYLPTRVDNRNIARRVFDPWARRPLELHPDDYFGTDSSVASSFSRAHMDRNTSNRNLHSGSMGVIDSELMRTYGDAPRYDDVVMSNVLSFDVKVWDPGAPLFTIRGAGGAAAAGGLQSVELPEVTLRPHDPGYKLALQQFINEPADATKRPSSFGAYVDMNYMWGGNRFSKLRNSIDPSTGMGYIDALEAVEAEVRISLPRPMFAGPGQAVSEDYLLTSWQSYIGPPNSPLYPPRPKAPDLVGALHEAWDPGSVNRTCQNLSRCGLASVYCTWSTHYEHNGIDDDRDGIIDNYTNGVDDPGSDPGVDDPSERETVPPYSAALRGVQVTIRAFEPDSRQIREVTITHEFLLE